MNWTMRRIAAAILVLAVGWMGDPRPARGEEPGGPLKVVVHMNVPDAGVQGAGLKNVTNILKEDPDARVVVVCHGAGIGLVEKLRSDHAETVASLVKQGVKFAACKNTMRQKSIREEDLLPGVETVPSGAVEVIRKQQREGYSYFKP